MEPTERQAKDAQVDAVGSGERHEADFSPDTRRRAPRGRVATAMAVRAVTGNKG